MSIVIAAYNQASLLAEAIASAMGQGHRPLEVIVVDDGSTDATREVVARWKSVRYIHQHNKGVAAARNRLSQIAILDSDPDPLLHLVGSSELVMAVLKASDARIHALNRTSCTARLIRCSWWSKGEV